VKLNDKLHGLSAFLKVGDLPEHRQGHEAVAIRDSGPVDGGGVPGRRQGRQHIKQSGVLDSRDGPGQGHAEDTGSFVVGDGAAGQALFLPCVLVDGGVHRLDGLPGNYGCRRELLGCNIKRGGSRALPERYLCGHSDGVGIVAAGGPAGFEDFVHGRIRAYLGRSLFRRYLRERANDEQIVKAGIIDKRGGNVDVHRGNQVIVLTH